MELDIDTQMINMKKFLTRKLVKKYMEIDKMQRRTLRKILKNIGVNKDLKRMRKNHN